MAAGRRRVDSELTEAVEQYHRAVADFVRGDPSSQERLFSRDEDVTLANPLGPPAHGWSAVSVALRQAAAQLSDGEMLAFERVSGSREGNLAYTHEIERCQVKLDGAPQIRLSSLRVTTVFRLEEDGWRILHRHADPITTPRPIESTLES
jgi:ketosteroid isomerase-like protein